MAKGEKWIPQEMKDNSRQKERNTIVQRHLPGKQIIEDILSGVSSRDELA